MHPVPKLIPTRLPKRLKLIPVPSARREQLPLGATLLDAMPLQEKQVCRLLVLLPTETEPPAA